jgi:hypothetical protein
MTSLDAAKRLWFKISDCFTPTAQWANNDLLTYTFADNAAAAAGGLLAGETYKTATGELRVVV